MRLISALHNSDKFIETQPSLPYEQQRSNNPAYHPREKGVRSKITIDKCILTPATRLKHRTNTGMRPRFQRIRLIRTASKGSKILAPQQKLACLIHQVKCQRLRPMVTIPCSQRRWRNVVPDRITIRATFCAVTRMKVMRDFLYPLHSHRPG